jgi:hypothetical protein
MPGTTAWIICQFVGHPGVRAVNTRSSSNFFPAMNGASMVERLNSLEPGSWETPRRHHQRLDRTVKG